MDIALDQIQINEDYKSLIPPLTKREYQTLLLDIETNGIYYPIILNEQHEIIDGHNRFQIACDLQQETIPAKIITFSSKQIEEFQVIDLNLSRRHLNNPQKAVIGMKIWNILKDTEEEEDEKDIDFSGNKMEIASNKVSLSRGTLDKVRRIFEVIENNDTIKIEWNKAIAGEKSIDAVYKKINGEDEDEETLRKKEAHKRFLKGIKSSLKMYLNNTESYSKQDFILDIEEHLEDLTDIIWE